MDSSRAGNFNSLSFRPASARRNLLLRFPRSGHISYEKLKLLGPLTGAMEDPEDLYLIDFNLVRD